MSTVRPFAYNTGPIIPGTIQIGDLAIGVDDLPYSEDLGGVKWWNGPDEDLGYVIAHPTPSGTQPNQLGIPAYVGFWRTTNKTDFEFIQLSQWISNYSGDPQVFLNAGDAKLWLNNNGFWTSYNENSPTPTPTATPTPTPTVIDLINPIITSQDEYINIGDELYLQFNESVTPIPTQTPTPTVSEPVLTQTPTPTATQSSGGDGWYFYTPEGVIQGPPVDNGDVVIISNGVSTFNPNYTTSPFNLFFNSYTSNGVSYINEFQNLDLTGGTITLSQNGVFATYSGDGDSFYYNINDDYLNISIAEQSQLVTSATTSFISGSPITLIINGSPSLTPTPTPTLQTPTPTPTPTETSLPVTGYSFNLVDLPYNFPSSGNSIMNNTGESSTGSTEINALIGSSRGFYFNSIDVDGIDRTSYFSAFTGQNITITFNQNGNVAIYSGDTNSFKNWISSGDTGFVFGTGVGVPPSGTPSGTATLLESSPVNYTIGQPVYVSISLNTPQTPTPTPTSTPTLTPSVSSSSTIVPTPTPTSVTSSGLTVNFNEVGSDVVMSLSGTLNVNDLTLVGSNLGPINGGGIGISNATFLMGTTPSNYDLYSGFTSVPSNFGTGGGFPPSSASGDIFGCFYPGGPPHQLAVPVGYTSGGPISSTQTFNNETFASMGLVTGTYTYSWGSGSNAYSVNVVIG